MKYPKAIVGAAVAGLGSLYQALDNGSVSAQEWVGVGIATLSALGAVWGAPYTLKRRARQQPPRP